MFVVDDGSCDKDLFDSILDTRSKFKFACSMHWPVDLTRVLELDLVSLAR